MAGDLPKIYWDADVFLSYVNELPERLAHIEWHLERSGSEFQLVTSTLSIAEVTFAEMDKSNNRVSAETLERIDSLWLADDSPVILAEVYTDIVIAARDLARSVIPLGWTMKGADAIHMATAKQLGVAEIHTYSTDWPRNAATLGIKITQPIAQTPKLRGV